MRKTRLSSLVGLALAAVVATACSDANLHSPLAPSALTAPEKSVATVTVDRTQVSDQEAIASWARYSGFMTAADGLLVEGSDVITAVSGTCPDRTVTVRGVPVLLNSGTMFGAGTTCAGLAVGTSVHIRGLLTVENGAYVLLANSLSVNTPVAQRGPSDSSGDDESGGDDQGPGRGRHASGEGTVASVRGACPTVSMLIRGYSVTTSVQTIYVGGTCGDLRPGTKVEVSGDAQGTAIVAESIEFKH